MDRRKVLLIVAAVIAVLGTLLVFTYVRGADARAAESYQAVRVLRAVKPIPAGTSVSAAQASGSITLGSVGRGDLVEGALSDLTPIKSKVATVTLLPGEQITTAKFSAGASNSSGLTIPQGKMAISVQLTDPGRVAGFVNPGANVAVFLNGTDPKGTVYSRLLLPKAEVIAVGTTTMVSTTTTDASGASTTEQLPRTLITLALDQAQAQKVLYGAKNGELALSLLGNKSVAHSGQGAQADNLF